MRKATVLIVDDLPDNIELIKTFFLDKTYNFISASNGREALEIIETQLPDLILLDVLMPVMDGFQVCEQLKSDERTRLIPVIMITGLEDSKSKIKGINLGVDDFITKPFNFLELKARMASLIKLKHYTDQLKNAEKILFNLALTLDAKDPYRRGHSQRLANYSSIMAEKIGLVDDDVRAVRCGGILHDIGKLAIQDEILLKPGPLTENEFSVVKLHPEIGAEMLAPLSSLDDVQPIIRHHRERYDGSGYPDGLVGEEIPIGAQVVAIADTYDALTSERSYRRGMSKEASLQIMDSESTNGKWNSYLYKEFKSVLTMKDIDMRINREVPELSYLN